MQWERERDVPAWGETASEWECMDHGSRAVLNWEWECESGFGGIIESSTEGGRTLRKTKTENVDFDWPRFSWIRMLKVRFRGLFHFWHFFFFFGTENSGLMDAVSVDIKRLGFDGFESSDVTYAMVDADIISLKFWRCCHFHDPCLTLIKTLMK